MHRRRLVGGLTVAFGAMSLLLAIVGVLTNPILLVLSAVFLVVTGLLYYQASGRLAERVYRSVERRASVDGGRARRRRENGAGRGGFGAGPREEWTGPHRREGRQRVGRGAGQQGRRRTRGQGNGQRGRRQRPPTATGGQGVTAREAYDVLGLDPGADQDAIRSAYRERIKEVHPDTAGGDEDAFRRVRTAYERLSE